MHVLDFFYRVGITLFGVARLTNPCDEFLGQSLQPFSDMLQRYFPDLVATQNTQDLGLVFQIASVGILQGQPAQVFNKAINICLECVGLG